MFCQYCGSKILKEEKFCSQCGYSAPSKPEKISPSLLLEERWWMRLAKVFYIVLYLPLLFIIPAIWSDNAPYYNAYSKKYYGSYEDAFWYSFLFFVIYMITARLIRISFLYVVAGQKPQWKKEFKRLF